MTAEPLGCDPERVTGWVDGVLDEAEREQVEAHLATCPDCREQAAFERELRGRLRALPSVDLPADLAARVERHLHRRRHGVLRVLLPLAAVLALLALWAVQTAPVVAWQLAVDHRYCFSRPLLPARVWTDDPQQVAAWFEQHGREIPSVPAAAGGLELLGGRFCPLIDRRVVHLYYEGAHQQLSLFVVPGPVRLSGIHLVRRRSDTVRLLHVGGTTVALVSDREEAVTAFERAMTHSLADPLVPSATRLASSR